MTVPNSTYTPERRPIASRNHPLSIRIATWIAGLGITPNAISVAGMIAGVLAGVAFACTTLPELGWIVMLAAAALMQLRLLANMLDGMVAVQTARASPVGELFNEVPDRVSDTAIFIGAGYAAGSQPELGYLAAIGALFTAYVRAEGKVAGAHQEFCGPLAKPQRMAVLTLAALYVALGPEAWQPQLSAWPGRSTLAWALLLIAVGSAITAIRRLARVGQALQRNKP
jgi:phosphatidylglycerophosphate synthase